MSGQTNVRNVRPMVECPANFRISFLAGQNVRTVNGRTILAGQFLSGHENFRVRPCPPMSGHAKKKRTKKADNDRYPSCPAKLSGHVRPCPADIWDKPDNWPDKPDIGQIFSGHVRTEQPFLRTFRPKCPECPFGDVFVLYTLVKVVWTGHDRSWPVMTGHDRF